MKKRILLFSCTLMLIGATLAQTGGAGQLLLKNYKPVSIYRIPVNVPEKAKFPLTDMHSHPYAGSIAELDQWVKTMDRMNIRKTVIHTMATGAAFDSLVTVYGKYHDRFELWCGFDYTGYDQPGFGPAAVKELERCYKKGAKGVGELGDKGDGEIYSKPVAGYGMHLDDPRMKPLLQKCAELHMPVNIHVAEPYWMYLPADSTNDGLMNAAVWQVTAKPGKLGHNELIQSLENAVRDNPKTIFIACHFANCEYDLSKPAAMLDKYPNLYLDIAARYAETATIPRYMAKFYDKYQDRLVYGTDMGMDEHMYRVTFRVLETTDEHFYESQLFGYHWAMNGFGLPDGILKKLYSENALKIRQHEK
ncbi:MAG TPA: amidohydrolase family protein [Bacteroidales bacterium]|nr:amidohydrolase family protein [Bacteroidales bacterium]